MRKIDFLAGTLDALYFSLLISAIVTAGNRDLFILSIVLIVITVISRHYISIRYGVPYPWDKEGWEEYNE